MSILPIFKIQDCTARKSTHTRVARSTLVGATQILVMKNTRDYNEIIPINRNNKSNIAYQSPKPF